MIDALQTLKQPLVIEEYHPEDDVYRVYVIENEIVGNFKIKNPVTVPNYNYEVIIQNSW